MSSQNNTSLSEPSHNRNFPLFYYDNSVTGISNNQPALNFSIIIDNRNSKLK